MNQGGHFDISNLESKLENLESELNDSSIWDDVSKANKLNQELASLKKQVDEYNRILNSIQDNLDMITLVKEETDQEVVNLLVEELDDIINCYKFYKNSKRFNRLKNCCSIRIYLSRWNK